MAKYLVYECDVPGCDKTEPADSGDIQDGVLFTLRSCGIKIEGYACSGDHIGEAAAWVLQVALDS